jgi:hypothetical protein
MDCALNVAKRKMKSNVKVLTTQEAQDLFQKFSAPLFRAANSYTRKEAAHELAKSLWIALITGPEVEDNVFQTLKETGISFEGIQVIKDRYYIEMKPIITMEELQSLKARYNVKKKKHDSP